MKIDKKITLWFSINRYGILLFIFGIIIFFGGLFFSQLIVLYLCLIVSIILMCYSFSIFNRYKQKLHAYIVLSRHNLKKYSEISLKEYMASPCGRVLIHEILRNINKTEEYSILKKKYGLQIYKYQKEVIKIYDVNTKNNF